MRIGTATTGAVLAAAGIAVLLAGSGILGAWAAVLDGGAAVLSPAVERWVAEREWFWPAAGGVAEAVALAGLLWFAVTARSALRRRWCGADGATRMQSKVACVDLLRDAREVPDVRAVRARLTGTSARPRLVLTVTCDPAASPADVRAALAGGPIARYRAAMDHAGLVVVLRLVLAAPAPVLEPA